LNRDEIIKAINGVLIDGFEVVEADLVPTAQLYGDLGLDSLDAIDMLVYLEESLNRQVNPALFKNVRLLGDVYNVVEQALAETVPLSGAVPPGADLVTDPKV
jgi:acyl carrier protein